MNILKFSLFLCTVFISSHSLHAMNSSGNISRLICQLPPLNLNDHTESDYDMDVDSQAPTPLSTPRNIYTNEDEDGCTPLYEAVCCGHIQEVKKLLLQYVSLDCSALQGRNLEDVTTNKKIKYLIKNAREDRKMVMDLFVDSLQQK